MMFPTATNLRSLIRLFLFGFLSTLLGWGTLGAAQQVIEDFEGGTLKDWVTEGAAFQRPVVRAADLQLTGYRGRFVLNSFSTGDDATGHATKEVTLTEPYLNFLISGGSHPDHIHVSLIVDGKPAYSATGNNTGAMRWVSWDVSEWSGKTAQLVVTDEATGSWGHINVDQLEQSKQRRTGTGLWRLSDYRTSPDYLQETYRPGYHFTPELNWMNDPNGLVFHDGQFHLFYQHNPLGNDWGHMSWGHAISQDLLHWQHLPIAIRDEQQEMAFSGSAVFDGDNDSGFGNGEVAPLVAIYTGHGDGRQTQNLAYSLNAGVDWRRYSGNPVLDIGEADFRDPKVFWHQPTERWIMVVSLATKKVIQFYGSADLKTWVHLSDFGPAGVSEKLNWECPDLFPLQVVGEDQIKWVLEADMGSGAIAGGSGSEYFIGDFDGETFVPDSESSHWVDYGRDFYAPVSWENLPESDGRRIWIGWMNNWETCLVPTYPWRSAMSIPRELTLKRFAEGLRLCQAPISELQTLRGKRLEIQETLNADHPAVTLSQSGKQLELQITFDTSACETAGIRVLKSGDQFTEIGFDRQQQTVYLDRTRSGNVGFHSAFPGVHQVKLSQLPKELTLQILVDQSSVEVFVDQGQAVITDLVFPGEDADQVELFTRGGETTVRGQLFQINDALAKPFNGF